MVIMILVLLIMMLFEGDIDVDVGSKSKRDLFISDNSESVVEVKNPCQLVC